MYRRSSFRRPVRRFGRAGFRRSGSRLTTVRRPIRWERGNFYFEFLHTHEIDGDRLINTVVPIASINALINSDGTTDVDAGRQLTEMTRALIVGGVKFTCVQNAIAFPGITNLGDDGSQSFAGSSSMMADSKVLLVSDNLFTDAATGIATPLAVESNFWTNTAPTSRIQEIQDIQSQFPKRIHWQNFKQHNHGFTNNYSTNFQSETTQFAPFHPQDQQVSNSHSTSNLRLRLRLQDDECLSFFLTSFLNRSETLASLGAEVQFKFTGTIWYRYVI